MSDSDSISFFLLVDLLLILLHFFLEVCEYEVAGVLYGGGVVDLVYIWYRLLSL